MYGQYPNYPPNDPRDPRIDRNYYDRIRNNNFRQPQQPMYPNQREPYSPYGQPNSYDTYGQHPYNQPYGPNVCQQPDPFRQQSMYNNSPQQGYVNQGYNTCISDTYQKPTMSTTTTSPNISIPDYSIPEPAVTCQSSTQPQVQEPVNKDLLTVIKDLKRQGYKPTPDSVKLPLYDERYYEPDVIIKGNFYSIILIPKN